MGARSFVRRRLALAAVAASAVSMAVAAAAPASAGAAARPGPPSGVTAAARDHGALVTWKAPSSGGGSPVTGYVITASPGGRTVRTAAVTSFLAGGLANGRAYRFTVAAVSAGGTGPASKPSPKVTPRAAGAPGPVRSVRVSAGFRQVRVSWSPPRNDGGAPVTGYRVTTRPATRAVSVPGDSRTATVSGLADGRAYRVSVTAASSAGRGRGSTSARLTPHVTAPAAPAAVTAASASAGVRVSWQPPVADGGSVVTGYVITVAGTSRTIRASARSRSVTVTRLTRGRSYTFRVAARNAKGTGPGAVSSPATARGTVAAGTVVLSAASLAALTQVRTDGSLVFTSPPAQVQHLAAGDIVAAGVSAATAQGFLGKVTSVTAGGSSVTVATVPASLDQALSAAGFGTSGELGSAQVTSFVPSRAGVRMLPPARAPASGSAGTISLSLDTTLYKSSDGRKVTAGGTVSLTPSVSFHASITCCVHTASQFTGSVTASAALTVSAQVSHEISGGYTLGTLHFAPITIDVMGVPVVVTPQLTVTLIAKGSVTAGLTAGAGESVTLGASITTSDAHVSARPFASRTTTFTPPALFGSLEAAGGVAADLSTRVNGLPGPSLTDSLWLAKLTADPSARPWWTLSLENALEADYHLSLLHHALASYHATISDVSVRLAQATDPYQGITITPDPASVQPGGQLQLHAQVAGAAAQKVTWNAPAGNGTITASGQYTAPDMPGTYQVTATSPASGLKPAATGLISIQVGDQPPGPPAGVAATSSAYGTAALTWTAPADTGGGAITGYTITAQPGGDRYPSAGTATTDTIGGLSPGTAYTFTVTATSDGGTSRSSAPSAPVVIDNVSTVSHWNPSEAPLPAGASATPDAVLESLACPSATACLAVGNYSDSSGDYQGLLVTGSGSSWTAAKAPLPADAAADPDPNFLSVACSTPAKCVAVGDYTGSVNNGEPLLLTGSGSSWTVVTPPLPTGVAYASYSSAACAPSSECVVTGDYTDSSGNTQGLLLTWSGSSWTAATAPLPAHAAPDPLVGLPSVSCTSGPTCVAAGSYYADSGLSGLLLTWTGSSWQAAQAPLPASGGSGGSLQSVSCASAARCVAAGYYTDTSDTSQWVLLTGLGTTWTAARAPLPAGADSDHSGNLLGPVTCASASACVMVGDYADKSFVMQGVVVTGSASNWTAAETPLPGGLTASPDITLNSVACPSGSFCVVAGYNFSSSGGGQGLLLTGWGGAWTPVLAPLPPPGSADYAGLSSVSCAAATSCVAIGGYEDTPGDGHPLLESGP